MKFLFILISVISFSACCISQIPQPNEIILNPHLNKFEGTWKWVSGKSEITIRLKKVNYLSKDGTREDVLMGVHKYILNDSLVEDYLSLFVNVGQEQKGSIYVWGKINNVSPDIVTGTIKDDLKHKQNYLSLTYIAGAIPQISLHISNLDGPYIAKNGQPQFDNSFTLPQDIVLVRQ